MCQSITTVVSRPLKLLSLFTLLLCFFICPVRAAKNTPAALGTVRIFDKDSDYEISENAAPAVPVTESSTYGKFQINGTLSELPEKDGVPAYRVSGNDLSFGYSCTDELLTAGKDTWHLIDDTGKKVDGQKLKEKIRKGAVIVQTSVDRKKWITVVTDCNVFADHPEGMPSVYKPDENQLSLQLTNGCFYRVTVVYELSRQTQAKKFLFIDTSDYEYKKCAEVYEFYAIDAESYLVNVDFDQTYKLGEAVRVKEFNGYAGTQDMEKDD